MRSPGHAKFLIGTRGTRTPPTMLRVSSERSRGGRPDARSSQHWALLEVAGIEPASFSTSLGLLRAQPAVVFSAPAVSQASRRRAQSLLGVPLSPATGLNGGSSLLMPDTGPEELPG